MMNMEKHSSLGGGRTVNNTGRGMLDENMIKRLLGEDAEAPRTGRCESGQTDTKRQEIRSPGSGKKQSVRPSPEQEPEGGETSETDNCKYPLDGYPLAMVYSPRQKFENIYNETDALNRGTIFEALDLPFVGSCHKAE